VYVQPQRQGRLVSSPADDNPSAENRVAENLAQNDRAGGDLARSDPANENCAGSDDAEDDAEDDVAGDDATEDDLAEDDLGRAQLPRTDLRRMVLGLLIKADAPMTVGEVTNRVLAEGPPLWLQPGQRPGKIISDLLRQQVASKRVIRVRTGVYSIAKITPSMRWRSLHWYQLRWDVAWQQRRIVYRPSVAALPAIKSSHPHVVLNDDGGGWGGCVAEGEDDDERGTGE
jgi:hypothetical protein